MYPKFGFIRHGQSLHNQKSEQVQYNNPKTPNYKSLPEYKAFKYLEDLLDCPITDKGKNSCDDLRRTLNYNQIDLVVVSPLWRALETCSIIFGDKQNINVIVQPLLTETVGSACDICARITESRQKYGDRFDFSRIPEVNQDQWQLAHILPERHRNKIYDELKEYQEKGGSDPKKIHSIALSIMKENITLETENDLRQRVKRLKKQLGNYRRLAKKKIILIGHSGIFKAITATSFTEKGQPINSADLPNTQYKQIPIIIDGDTFEEDNEAPFCKF